MNSIDLLDIVALTVDLPEHKLIRGQVGTVVEILAGGKAFDGRTYKSLGLQPDHIMVLHYEPMKTESMSAVEDFTHN
jgi:hypothetical protein